MAVCVAQSLASTVKLNDGVEMPLFGIGLYKQENVVQAVSFSLSAGYRLLDTAVFYKNEVGVGQAIKNSGLKREEIFLVSKLWHDEHGYNKAVQAVKDSLKRLDTDYIDLYLIHSPFGGQIVETYDALLHLKAQGLIRSVGVSNFGLAVLEGLYATGRPMPSVNQIELHPWSQKTDIVKWCRKNGVAVMGFSPLAKGKRLNDEQALAVAKKCQKSVAQVLIRWSVQKGYITIPKSSQRERIIENSEVFDWSLTDEEISTMDSFPQQGCLWSRRGDPTDDPWEG